MIRSYSSPCLDASTLRGDLTSAATAQAGADANSQALLSQLLIACSTYVPTDTHELEIRRQLTHTLPAQLETIDSQIQHLRTALNDLCRQRAAILGVVGMHSASVSVVRRLPTEILYDIFMKIVWNEGREELLFASEQLRLMRVCRRWEEVIRGSPKLWTNVEISGHAPFSTTRHYSPENLNRLLGLSQDLPIFVNVCSPNTIPPSVWAVLASHSTRWRRAKLTINYDHIKLVSDMMVEFTNLEELCLVCVGEGLGPNLIDAEGDNESLCAFERVPRLKCVSITDHVAHSYSSRIALPWTQLDRLECIGHYVPQPNTSSTAFAHLHHLSYLPANHIVSPSDALDNLTLPSLQTLSLGQYHHASAISLIERSFCRVQKLVLGHAWVRDLVLDLLDVCPGLVELRVTVDDYTPFERLWGYLSVGEVLKGLERLVVELSGYTRQVPGTFQGGMFLGMVRKRYGVGAAKEGKERRKGKEEREEREERGRLKMVRLTNIPKYSASFNAVKVGLDELRDAGVDVDYVFRD